MPKRILVIDDEKDIQELISIILTPPDYEVECVTSGQAALDKLAGGDHPDILLLDLMMPDMTGYALLDQLYERGLHTSLSIIVMSADVLTKQQIIRLGIKGFLTKPFNISDLENLVKKL